MIYRLHFLFILQLISLSIYLPNNLSIYLFIYLSVYLLNYLSIYLFFHLSIYLSHLFIYDIYTYLFTIFISLTVWLRDHRCGYTFIKKNQNNCHIHIGITTETTTYICCDLEFLFDHSSTLYKSLQLYQNR